MSTPLESGFDDPSQPPKWWQKLTAADVERAARLAQQEVDDLRATLDDHFPQIARRIRREDSAPAAPSIPATPGTTEPGEGAGGGDIHIANLEAELRRIRDAARKEILGEQGKRLAALVERDDARAGWQEAEKALTAWMEKLNGQIGLRMAVEAELAQARQRIAELEKGIAEIKAGTRIGWFMTDLGAKCSKLLNP